MTKPIRKYPEEQRYAVVSRRLKVETLGCGYWAAIDFSAAIEKARQARIKAERELERRLASKRKL